MDNYTEQLLSQIATAFLYNNYDYLFLRTMLEMCMAAPTGSTLITGSSHALNGIQESAWTHAINCSMHSQDIYYDFQCAKRAILSAENRRFDRCFIIMGYYIAYQDLSRSKVSRETVISNVYYPIFQDAHNWESPVHKDLWAGIGDIPDSIKTVCEQAAVAKLLEYNTYYSEIHPRGQLFDLQGRTWGQASEAERLVMGRMRAKDHNGVFQHKASFEENKTILCEFIRFLYGHDVQPIVVITPFTKEYNRFILPEMKAGVFELIDAVPKDVHYVDFNQALELFDATDFMDTDHLSATGAEKVSRILVEMFGM